MTEWRRGAVMAAAAAVAAALGLSLLGSRTSARVEPSAVRLDAYRAWDWAAWSAPQAVARGLPSGLRRVAAGWFWVGAWRAWEREDARELRRALAWTLALRPEQVGYWIEGARMLAFDLPQWSGGDALQRRRALEEALRLLAEAEHAHPMAGVIPLEIGWLRGWELGDLEGAERALARAARLGSSARQAERLRARVLERLSPSEDAKRAWKTGRQIHPPMVPGARLGSEP